MIGRKRAVKKTAPCQRLLYCSHIQHRGFLETQWIGARRWTGRGPCAGKGKGNIDSCLPPVCMLICPFPENSPIFQHPPIDSHKMSTQNLAHISQSFPILFFSRQNTTNSNPKPTHPIMSTPPEQYHQTPNIQSTLAPIALDTTYSSSRSVTLVDLSFGCPVTCLRRYQLFLARSH